MNSAKFIGRKRLAIDFESDELYTACQAVEPFLDRLVLVGGWALRVQINIRQNTRSGLIPYTQDADFAIQLTIKEDFMRIRNHLLSVGFNLRKPLEYAFQRGDTFIDMLPFGDTSAFLDFDLKEYRLAFEDNDILTVKNTSDTFLSLRVIGIASLTVHKIFSIPTVRRKDKKI